MERFEDLALHEALHHGVAHADRAEQRRPEFIERVVGSLQPGQMAIGVDEDTAVIWTENTWRVMGHQRAVLFKDGERIVYRHDEVIGDLPPPGRASKRPSTPRWTTWSASSSTASPNSAP